MYKEGIVAVGLPRTSGLNECVIITVCLFDVFIDLKVDVHHK